jgi:Fe-S cluster biogenesis protein NfuA
VRRRREGLKIARGPSLHVVVSDALAHRLHPRPSLALGGGDCTHDGLFDTSTSCGLQMKASCNSCHAPANSLSTSVPRRSRRHAALARLTAIGRKAL